MTPPAGDDTTQTPAEAYQAYYGPAIFERHARILLELAALRPGERVLDLACGTGIVARQAARIVGPSGKVVGVDLNPAMVEVARAQPAVGGAPLTYRQGDATALDAPSDAFDVVTCQQGFQFFPDRPAAAAHMRRVLVDGGRAVVACWLGIEEHPLYEALTEAELPHLRALGVEVSREELTAPFSLGDPDELRALLEGVGFRDVEVHRRTVEARFADADRFVERLEYAYAAVVPTFATDPQAFAHYLGAISRDAAPVVTRHRDGDEIVTPMHTHVAVART